MYHHDKKILVKELSVNWSFLSVEFLIFFSLVSPVHKVVTDIAKGMYTQMQHCLTSRLA